MTSVQRKAFQHLSTSILPTHYALTLHPDLQNFTFKGEESIDISVNESSDSVRLNSVDINVGSATFSSGGASVSAVNIEACEKDETVTLTFPENLPLGPAKLHLSFTGILNDQLKGFYRSSYIAGDGSKKPLAVTHFEATGARRAFPCWDEPAIKATFDVTLCVPTTSKYVALSNMPVIKEEITGDVKAFIYDRSPIMSTYLIAFAVGEFDFVEKRDKNGVLIRVYTPIGKKDQGLFALDVAVKTLPFYTEYFEIPYTLPKLDLIAIPDLAGGAMENWGLITYRETALLVDPQNTSSGSKQWVALIVGHELAHNWFGNLVTMQWWTHLWLKEGFATWIEFLAVEYCFPDWNIWLQYVNMVLKWALQLDALDNSHPIEVPVGHPTEVDEIFDAISYNKGSCVIGMLHNWLGAEPFRKGLALYLKRHQYKNTVTEDLWAALEETSQQPVNKVMSTWTGQMGYPMLTVDLHESADTLTLHFKQQKFCANGDNFSDAMWLVPITVISQSNGQPQTFLLEGREGKMVLEGAKPGDWVKVNPHQIGVFRVKYSEVLLQRLLPAIKNEALSAADRLGIQEDLSALAKAGYCSTTDLLTLMGSFVKERNYVVLGSINSNLSELVSLFDHLPCVTQLKTMRRRIFSAILSEVGWEKRESDSHTDALLRSMLIGTLGKSEDQEVVSKCQEMFAEHVRGVKQIPADIRGAVYSTVRICCTDEEKVYGQLLSLFEKTELHEERVRIIQVLGCGPSDELRAKTLEFGVSDKVRSNDTTQVLAGVTASGSEGREAAWQFVKTNYSVFLDRCSGMYLFQRLILGTCVDFTNMNMYNDVKEFFEHNPAPSAERAVKQSLESIKLRSDWLDRDAEGVADWLERNVNQ